MRRALLLAACVLVGLTGCFTAPFKPPEMTPVGDVHPEDVVRSFAGRIADLQETEDTLIFRFLWRKIAVLGLTRVNREARTFEAISFNHLGVPLFRISGDEHGNHLRYALPELKKHPRFRDNVGNDIRRIHFDLVPSRDARPEILRDRILFREDREEGRLEHVYGGQGNLLVEKRMIRSGRLRWRVNYYEYAEADGCVYPRGVVLYNARDHYRLIVRTRGITFDLEETRNTETAP